MKDNCKQIYNIKIVFKTYTPRLTMETLLDYLLNERNIRKIAAEQILPLKKSPAANIEYVQPLVFFLMFFGQLEKRTLKAIVQSNHIALKNIITHNAKGQNDKVTAGLHFLADNTNLLEIHQHIASEQQQNIASIFFSEINNQIIAIIMSKTPETLYDPNPKSSISPSAPPQDTRTTTFDGSTIERVQAFIGRLQQDPGSPPPINPELIGIAEKGKLEQDSLFYLRVYYLAMTVEKLYEEKQKNCSFPLLSPQPLSFVSTLTLPEFIEAQLISKSPNNTIINYIYPTLTAAFKRQLYARVAALCCETFKIERMDSADNAFHILLLWITTVFYMALDDPRININRELNAPKQLLLQHLEIKRNKDDRYDAFYMYLGLLLYFATKQDETNEIISLIFSAVMETLKFTAQEIDDSLLNQDILGYYKTSELALVPKQTEITKIKKWLQEFIAQNTNTTSNFFRLPQNRGPKRNYTPGPPPPQTNKQLH